MLLLSQDSHKHITVQRLGLKSHKKDCNSFSEMVQSGIGMRAVQTGWPMSCMPLARKVSREYVRVSQRTQVNLNYPDLGARGNSVHHHATKPHDASGAHTLHTRSSTLQSPPILNIANNPTRHLPIKSATGSGPLHPVALPSS